MKAVQIVKPNDLRIVDMEKPGIDQEKNVLIKMTASGICGSDVGIYHGTNAAATYPRVIGHEIVGVVDEIGEGVTKVKVGDRVIIDQITACGHCYACMKTCADETEQKTGVSFVLEDTENGNVKIKIGRASCRERV